MEANLRWYRQGTVTINGGVTLVSGTNTEWEVSGIKPGDILILNEGVSPDIYEISEVIDDTSLRIGTSYRGSTLQNASYAIIRNFNNAYKADIAEDITEIIKKYDKYGVEVIDNLTTDRANAAASANMARVLNANKADKTLVGALSDLRTSAKSNVVAAINEIVNSVGSLSDLSTTAKTSLVAAINEVAADIVGAEGEITTIGAGIRNCIFRGKSLGTEVTAAQYASIAAGTFDDMFIGDYWTIGNFTWRIAHFDYYLHCGDTECTTHHVTLVPDERMYTARMNATNTTEGGYMGSEMYTTNLDSAKTTIEAAFGSEHILTHRELLSNATANGLASGWTWVNSSVELMNSVQVYGAKTTGFGTTHLDFNTGIDCVQFALFALRKDLLSSKRYWWWLRDVASASSFAHCGGRGDADNGGASDSAGGVRPRFSLKS